MTTLIFIIVAIAVFSAAIVLFARRPKTPADGGLRSPEQSVESTGANVADALEGATPYVPEAMRDRPEKAGGLRSDPDHPAPPGDDSRS